MVKHNNSKKPLMIEVVNSTEGKETQEQTQESETNLFKHSGVP